MTFFNRGSRKIRRHLNDQSDRLDSLLNYNLRGDGIIEVGHIGQGQVVRLNINQLRQRLGVGLNATIIRKAFASVAAGASGTIACYLDTDGVGDTVDVVCEVADGETDLNSALPRLRDGDMIHVYNDNGTWRSIMTFQASGPC